MESIDQFSNLSNSLQSFLQEKFQNKDDVLKSSDLVSLLHKQCEDLDQSLKDLNKKLEASVITYASHSNQICGLFNGIEVKLNDLKLSTSVSGSLLDGEALGREKQILGEELPALAKEVARVETVRIYAETALKLDTLIGDIEDTVSSTMAGNLRKPSGSNLEVSRL
ncbi:Rint1-like protein mag2 [Thalictrum thalictroides]|uniref:Rint1-like protein mag2 n=1 Tax=Thalictrum thalictroides TaxID=46969 RepID=A0A7J6X6D4_THATH|nr:Rint1-like protein mag2 [Thalictrum thalictroides]